MSAPPEFATIETPRLRLRRFAAADLPAFRSYRGAAGKVAGETGRGVIGMSDSHDRDAWRSWPRRGEGVVAPPGTSFSECLHAMWMLTCEEYGIDPDNPPPMRKDVVRIIRNGHPRDD